MFQTPVFRRRLHGGKSLTRSIKQRLWTEEDLLASGGTPRPKNRTRDTRVKSWADSIDGDDDDDLENTAPDDVGVPFRQPRAKLRFGICFTGKSSSGGHLTYTCKQ